jgi:hypothetical protein
MGFLNYLEEYEKTIVGETLIEDMPKKPGWATKKPKGGKNAPGGAFKASNPKTGGKSVSPNSVMPNPTKSNMIGQKPNTGKMTFTAPKTEIPNPVKNNMSGSLKAGSTSGKFTSPPSQMGVPAVGGGKGAPAGQYKSPPSVMGGGAKSNMAGQSNLSPGAKFVSPPSQMGGGGGVAQGKMTFKSPPSEMTSPYAMKGVPTTGKAIAEQASSILDGMDNDTGVHIINENMRTPVPMHETMKQSIENVASKAASLL